MVQRIQDIQEYYDSYEDDDDPLMIFYAPTYFSAEEQLVIIACLMLLEQRYRVLESMTPSEVVDEIDAICDSLYQELVDVASERSLYHIRNYFNDLLDDFSIPHDGYVSIDTSMMDIMRDSIKGSINQLGDELKVKGKFFTDNLSKDSFNIIPNFKRASQKLIDAVGNNLIYGKEKSKRNVQKFVYGEDKLYRWHTMNDSRVCGWCRVQESLPPRTIDEMPLDHPRGRCTIDPIDYAYSDEYYLMLARANDAGGIDAFGPVDDERWLE